MNKTRRRFISQLSLLTGAATFGKPFNSAGAIKNYADILLPADKTLTIYHTNDLHGNIKAVYKNMGGLSLIKAELEKENAGRLLLDAGAFINSQASVKDQTRMVYMMNAMGYKAAGISASELSAGADNLSALNSHMQFTLVNCNHQFENDLALIIKPYVIISCSNIKVGITGVCSPLKNIKSNDPILSANKMASFLKNDKHCDLVICLSHLGSQQADGLPDNQKLANNSENIDMIIGGDNKKILLNMQVLHNKLKHEVILAQTGWKGLMAGKTVIDFNKQYQKIGIQAEHFIPGSNNRLFAATLSGMRADKNIMQLV